MRSRPSRLLTAEEAARNMQPSIDILARGSSYRPRLLAPLHGRVKAEENLLGGVIGGLFVPEQLPAAPQDHGSVADVGALDVELAGLSADHRLSSSECSHPMKHPGGGIFHRLRREPSLFPAA